MNIIATFFTALLLFSLSACGNSLGGALESPTTQHQSQTNKTTKNAENNSPSNQSTNTSDHSTHDTSNNSSNSTSSNENCGLEERIDDVFTATLKYESNEPNTTVDFKSYTMTQSGKKVKLTIVPTSDHQDDFKEGFVKEVVNNKDETHDATLFQYKIDSKNILSLLDSTTEKVVYATSLTVANDQAVNQPNGAWVKTFKEELYKNYHVTPSRYKYIGNGNWEVWVKEIDTGVNPYVTVNQNTGDFHG